jgi:thymidylate kinase
MAEKNKLEQVVRLSKKYNKIILDRSFLSILAFSYAKSKVDDNQNYQRLLNHYYKIKHQVVLPTKVFFLDCNILESVTRRNEFINNLEYRDWFDLNFLKYFREFYKKEIHEIAKVQIIYLDTGKLSEHDKNKKLLKLLNL